MIIVVISRFFGDSPSLGVLVNFWSKNGQKLGGKASPGPGLGPDLGPSSANLRPEAKSGPRFLAILPGNGQKSPPGGPG